MPMRKAEGEVFRLFAGGSASGKRVEVGLPQLVTTPEVPKCAPTPRR